MTTIMAKQRSAFGKRLRALRLAAGLTHQQLADRSGLNVGTVTKLEYGPSQPTWPKVVALARALGVSVSAFDEGDKPRKK